MEGIACLSSTEGPCVSGLAGDSYGRVQCSSERHSSTHNHLVSEGLWELGSAESVVLTLGLVSGSIVSN